MPGVTDSVWSAQGTTPGDIEAALRAMLKERHSENASYVPARTLNLVCVVDKQWSGEIANRLRHVGRSHAARTIVCAVEPPAAPIDAVATIASDVHPRPGEFALLRETVIVDVGEQHLAHLDTIVDPLVVTDLPTVVWAPHGHTQAVEALLRSPRSCRWTPSTSPTCATARAMALLATRTSSTSRGCARRRGGARRGDVPAAPAARPADDQRRDGPPPPRVGGRGGPADGLAGVPAGLAAQPADDARRHARRLRPRAPPGRQAMLEPANDLMVRGLAGVTLETASGRHFDLDRGPGGLQALPQPKGQERRWVVLGASRGEAGTRRGNPPGAPARPDVRTPSRPRARPSADRGAPDEASRSSGVDAHLRPGGAGRSESAVGH